MKAWAFSIVAVVVLGMAFPAAAGLLERQGVVAEVQLVDISSLDGNSLLILALEDGGGFLVPGQRNLAAGSGMEVAVEYLPGEQEGDLPLACRVRVLAVPLSIDGKEVLQPAARPFEIYRNPASHCQTGEVVP